MRSVRRPGLDLVRCLAILTVLVFHLAVESRGAFWPAFGGYGLRGTDLSFILSGFLIGSQIFILKAQGRNFSMWTFLRRRWTKTLPPFLLVLAIYFLVPWLRESPTLPPLWKFLTFTQNWGFDRAATAFSHAWFLCIEEQFYLLLPIVTFFFLPSAKIRTVVIFFLSLVVVGMVARGLAWEWWVAPLQGQTRAFYDAYHEYIYYPTHTRMDGLLAGLALALLAVFRPQFWAACLNQSRWLFFASAVLILITMEMNSWGVTFASSVLIFPLRALAYGGIIAWFMSPQVFFARYALPGIHFLSKLSYGLYLVHKLVFHWCRLNLPTHGIDPYGPLGLVITFLMCFLVAVALYFAVSMPVMRWLEKREGRATLPAAGSSGTQTAPPPAL